MSFRDSNNLLGKLKRNFKMYRYSSQRYNRLLLYMGMIRIGTLLDFRRMEHKKGILDPQEGVKDLTHHIDHLHIANPNDPNMKNNMDLKALKSFPGLNVTAENFTIANITFQQHFDAPDCFILCTSKICSKETLSQFEGANSCVEIVEIDSFYRILTDALNNITPVEFIGIHEIVYQDRIEQWNGHDWGCHPALIKETKYKKQHELRAIWQPLNKKPIAPLITADHRLGKFCRNVEGLR